MADYSERTCKLKAVLPPLKTAIALFTLVACLLVTAFLVRYHSYKKLFYKLLLCFVSSSILTSLSILVESIGVDFISQGYNFSSDVDCSATSDNKTAICTISGALILYSNWMDTLVITTIILWLIWTTVKPKLLKSTREKMIAKKKRRQTIWECSVLLVFLIVPLLLIIPPVVNNSFVQDQGPWCRIQTVPVSAMQDEKRFTVELWIALGVWYIPLCLVLLLNASLLTYTMIRLCFKLRESYQQLKQYHIDVLKDGISLGIFLILVCSIYLFEFLGVTFFIAERREPLILWLIEVLAFSVRGVAIVCLFCNPKMRRKIIGLRITKGRAAQAQVYLEHLTETEGDSDTEEQRRTPTQDLSSVSTRKWVSMMQPMIVDKTESNGVAVSATV